MAVSAQWGSRVPDVKARRRFAAITAKAYLPQLSPGTRTMCVAPTVRPSMGSLHKEQGHQAVVAPSHHWQQP